MTTAAQENLAHVVLPTALPRCPDLPWAQARQPGALFTERTLFADLELSPAGGWTLELHNGLGYTVVPLGGQAGLSEAEAELARQGYRARGDWVRWESTREVGVPGSGRRPARVERAVVVRFRLIVEWMPEDVEMIGA